MEHPNTFVKGSCVGQKHRVPCTSCGGNLTLHTVEASVTETEYVLGIAGSVAGSVDTDHEIVQCDGCQSLSFRTFWCASNEDPEYHALPADRARLFPPRLEGRRPLVVSLPRNIDAIYRETHAALCSGLEILAGIGIRAIVEAVCRKKGALKGDLEKKIERLVELGVLSKNDAKALHRLRDLGNLAAHEARSLGLTKLNVAMNVVEQLLAQVYYLNGAAVKKHLPRKRKKADPKAKAKAGMAAAAATIKA